MTVAMKIGNVDCIHSHVLKCGNKFRRALEVSSDGIDRYSHVVVTREGDVAGQLWESILMRITQRFAQRLLRRGARKQVKHTKTLARARRRVEPGFERAFAVGHLTDTKSKRAAFAKMVSTSPGELQVVGPIAGEIELMWWWKADQGTVLTLRNDGAMPNGNWLIGRLRIHGQIARTTFDICPPDALPTGRFTD